MGVRATQLTRQALVTPRPAARVTQLSAGTLLTPNPSARVTQLLRDTLRSKADRTPENGDATRWH